MSRFKHRSCTCCRSWRMIEKRRCYISPEISGLLRIFVIGLRSFTKAKSLKKDQLRLSLVVPLTHIAICFWRRFRTTRFYANVGPCSPDQQTPANQPDRAAFSPIDAHFVRRSVFLTTLNFAKLFPTDLCDVTSRSNGA